MASLPSPVPGAISRRQLLEAAAGGAAAYGLLNRPWVLDALAAPARRGRLHDIEHVVIFVQENRSFDCYFGKYPGVRGFSDPHPLLQRDGLPVFAQPGYDEPGFDGHLYPFHLDTNMNGECTTDISHDWGPQHRYWHDGKMNHFVSQHLALEGPQGGATTMGYYRRSDLRFYYALADAFTICDGYHCSVLGPTDPNQVYLASGMLDPAGTHGGPILKTYGSPRADKYGSLTWTTMPEQLQERGISWKVYAAPDNYDPIGDSPFPFFQQYYTRPELGQNGLTPTFPGTFQTDCANGTLPSVSWVYASPTMAEHPPSPVSWGEDQSAQVVSALTANKEVWDKTVLFITWDENGGYFDHVPPPVPPPGTHGEFVTADPLPSEADGIRGPIGLGFRVPLLVVSPFSRGGFVCSETFDHTSILRFIETRFGAEVPHLTNWRRKTTGDLTAALNLIAPDSSIPNLPATSAADPRVTTENCPTNAPISLIGGIYTPLGGLQTHYPVPPNHMPKQERGKPKRPSGPHPKHHKKHHHKPAHHKHHAHHHRGDGDHDADDR